MKTGSLILSIFLLAPALLKDGSAAALITRESEKDARNRNISSAVLAEFIQAKNESAAFLVIEEDASHNSTISLLPLLPLRNTTDKIQPNDSNPNSIDERGAEREIGAQTNDSTGNFPTLLPTIIEESEEELVSHDVIVVPSLPSSDEGISKESESENVNSDSGSERNTEIEESKVEEKGKEMREKGDAVLPPDWMGKSSIARLPELLSGGAEEFRELVSPECFKAIVQLRKDPVRALEANFASGRVLESFALLAEAGKKDPEAIRAITYGHVSSMGNPDACSFLEEYHYCQREIVPSVVKVGWCMPVACTGNDIDNVLVRIMPASGSNTSDSGDSSMKPPMPMMGSKPPQTLCGDTVYPLTAGSWVMISLCALLIIATGVGSYLDSPMRLHLNYYLRESNHYSNGNINGQGDFSDTFIGNGSDNRSENANGFSKFLRCFSLYKNVQLLVAPSRGGSFEAFEGIRVFSMLWVIFGHTFFFVFMTGKFSNLNSVLPGFNGFIERFSAQALTGGFFAVDTFFFMSGFLGCYLMLKNLSKGIPKSSAWLPALYLHRWIRLTPTYLFLVCFNWFIITRVDSGPFWNAMANDMEMCPKYWWANVLYVNNFLDKAPGCYGVSWYLANDMQFFIVTPLMVLIALRNKYLGMLVPSVVIVASSVYFFVVSYQRGYGVFVATPSFFKDYYVNPWARCPAYLIGVLLAMLWFFYLEKMRDQYIRMRFHQRKRYTMLLYGALLLSFVLMGLTVYGARGAYTTLPFAPSIWSRTTMAAYVSLSKQGWTFALAIFSIVLFFGEGGIVRDFLECHVFTVLARLCFCCYLIHPMILMWYIASDTQPVHFSSYWYAFNYCATIFLTFSSSVVVHLCLERPLQNMERLMRSPVSSRKEPENFEDASLKKVDLYKSPSSGNPEANASSIAASGIGSHNRTSELGATSTLGAIGGEEQNDLSIPLLSKV